MPRPPRSRDRNSSAAKTVESQLRVVGGDLRGRTIHYNGDSHLRPMKDRVREALFNVLGPKVRGTHVYDLFAGTGAMSFESISRGALRATLIERRFPNAKVIEDTAAELGVSDRVSVTGADAFIWVKSHELDTTVPWLVFICPPYEMHVSRRDDMSKMIRTLWEEKNAPTGSMFVVESDERFSPENLPDQNAWQMRQYLPAMLWIAHKN